MPTARRLAAVTALTLTATLTACSTSTGSAPAAGGQGSPAASGGALKVFATTGYLGDLVKNIDPTAEVTVMVKPGGDPHTYQPSTQDTQKMQEADVVFSSGVHMEAQMLDQLKGLGAKQVAVGDQVPTDMLLPWPEKDAQGNALHDPHIWNSPEIWKIVTDKVSGKLGETAPARKDEFAKNAEKYKADIDATATKVKNLLAPIPKAGRVLITGHDAFNYFGKTFGLEIHATDFVTSEADMSAAQLQDLAKLIATHKVPTIFQDNLKNPQAIKSLQEAVKANGWNVTISDKELYADSLGESAPVDTYLGVMEHNAKTIADALAPKK